MSLWTRLFSRLSRSARASGAAETPRAGASAEDGVIDDFLSGPAIPDDLVDAVLDGEVSAERAGEAMAALRRSADARRRLSSTRRIVDQLQADRAAAAFPDFSGSILKEVDRRKGLMDRRGMRRVTGWRIAAGFGLVALAAAGFFAQRVSPGTLNLAAKPAPLGELAQSVPVETAGVVSNMREAVIEIRRLMSPGTNEPGMMQVTANVGSDPFVAQSMPLHAVSLGTARERGPEILWGGFRGPGAVYYIPTSATVIGSGEAPIAATSGFGRPASRADRVERMSIRALFIEPGRDEDEDDGALDLAPGR